MRSLFILSLILLVATASHAQTSYADSIRVKYHMPELAYAVVSADSILEQGVLGVQRANTNYKAQPNDRFRIGSNTKAITGFIAAQLVKQGKIKWDTKFFDLYPELKAKSKAPYRDVTLLQLLTFRTRLIKYTYTYSKPTEGQFTGDEAQQRYQFAQWFFSRPPVKDKDSIHFSNLGYTAAAMMLEKVTGKDYKILVKELGAQLDIDFGFGAPNTTDTLQPWGHNAELVPEPPADNYKLNWLLAAGNINVSLPDYIKFIQLQLQGLQAISPVLSSDEFDFLHYGLPRFSVGWFRLVDGPAGMVYSYNIGNPGTFLSKVYVCPEMNRAYIILTNVQSEDADKGMDELWGRLKERYNR